MISAISVKDRLKNQAVASGKTFQEALTAYGLERTVYRLSVSEYVERFTLKGGTYLYALFLKKKKALVNAELEDVVDLLKTLRFPIVKSITVNIDYSAKWDHESRSWK